MNAGLASTVTPVVFGSLDQQTTTDLCDAKNYEGAKQNITHTLEEISAITNDKFSPELLPLIEMLREYLIVLDTAIKNEK